MDVLELVCALKEYISITEVCTLFSWLGIVPQPRFGHCHQWHIHIDIHKQISFWSRNVGISWKQATLAVTSADLIRGPGSCIVTQHVGNRKTEGEIW